MLCFPSYFTPVLKLVSVTKVDSGGFIQEEKNASKIVPIKPCFRKLRESVRKRAFNSYIRSARNLIAVLRRRNDTEIETLPQHSLKALSSSACHCDYFVAKAWEQ